MTSGRTKKRRVQRINFYADHGESCTVNHEGFAARCLEPASTNAIKDPLPPAVVQTIKPIFEDLSSTKLLKRCSNICTQNNNDYFHSVWSFVPKSQCQFRPIPRPILDLGLNLVILIIQSWILLHIHQAVQYIVPSNSSRV